jgi:hemerythrin-like domain-containing protein
MTRPPQNADRTARSPFGASDLKLLATPLDFIQSEHLRHRQLCAAAEQLASAEHFDPEMGQSIVDFLETEMALHVLDEEEDLFPLLRRRAKPGDGADRILGLLSGEHAADEVLAHRVCAGLRNAVLSRAQTLPEDVRNALLTFADRERRHLTVENAIVLPLAQKRLSRRDLQQLSRRMAARRGLSLPEAEE